MKIGVVGCGALGSFYGARLLRAGTDVWFLLRSDYPRVREHGLRIQSVDGDFEVRPQCARQPAEIGVCDVVLIGLKTTANPEFPRLIPPLTGPQTLVVTLQNGLGNEEALAALLGPDNILGALCFVCLNRVEPGLILHTAHGRIVLGEFQRKPLARTSRLAEMFRSAGIQCELAENLAAAHWEKLVWNIPFNGLGVAASAGYDAVVAGHLPARAAFGPCWPTDRLLQDPRWERLVRELMWEVVSTAHAKGYPIADDVVDQNVDRTRIMGEYKASTLIDFERGYPLELQSMFREPLRQAVAAGVSTPRLAALCQVLEEVERAKLGG